ncbi:MAG: ABC transporter permease [Ignavibacteriales bacterium]|nr:ABC transporter permease [Ignavibacteriales bacterium]
MDICAVRMLKAQPIRLGLTIGSVSLCVVLMLFLISVYGGVSRGAVEYVRQNKVDLWVLQGNSTNIMRGTSILSSGHGALLRSLKDVKVAAPILMLLPAVKKGNDIATVYLAGYDHRTGIGGPPALAEGRTVFGDNEIVLDKAFAARFSIQVGDTVSIQDEPLVVVGLSLGTNAFVIQYAFVTIERGQSFVGFPGVTSCYLVNVAEGSSVARVKELIQEELPGLEVFDHSTFLRNNIREMESGFLTLLYSIAFIGSIVLTAILSLLLSINIIERRKDFAIMKALGAPQGFLPMLIVQQSMLISIVGSVLAVALFFPLVSVIEAVAPEVSSQTSPEQIAIVVLAVSCISLLSSFLAMQRLRHIYPLETFS